MPLRQVLILLISLVGTFSGYAKVTPTTKALRATHFTVTDGLSSNVVHYIFQDSKGFIWIGTRNGLNKYDGYSFRHYFHKPFEKYGLPGNVIDAITEDSSGNVWIGTDGGLARLDRKTDRIVSFVNDPSDTTTLGNNSVVSLLVDSKDRLWVALRNGELDLYDRSHNTFRRYRNVHSSFQTHQFPIIEYAPDSLFLHDSVSIIIFSAITGKPSSAFSKKHFRIYPVAVNDRMILRRGDSLSTLLYEYDPIRRTIGDSIILPRAQYNNSYIYYGNGRSYYCLGPRGLEAIDFSAHTSVIIKVVDQLGIDVSASSLKHGICDSDGSFWLATINNGILYIDKRKQRFQSYLLRNEVMPVERLETRFILATGDGGLWAGGVKGSLFEFDRSTHSFKQLKVPFTTSVNTIVEDEQNALWLGTTAGSIFKMDRQTRTLRRFNIERFTQVGAYCSYKDADGSLWFGMLEGFDKQKENLIHVVPRTGGMQLYDRTPNSKFMGAGIWSILGEGKDSLWLATMNGLVIFDKRTSKFATFTHSPADRSTISHNNVWVLHRDKTGNLWCGTWGGGLNLLKRPSMTFEHFTMDDGLPSNVIHSILEDSGGCFWIGTANGISRFDPKARSFTNYNTNDGLLDDEYSPNACAVSSSGEFLFGGLSGITGFYPGSFTEDLDKSPLIFTGLSIFDTLYVSELASGDTVLLRHDQNYLTLEFARLNFQSAGKNFYEYQLDGVDQGWISAGHRNSISYNDLSPGTYIFRVRSSGSSSFKDARQSLLWITITPPFWNTSWFHAAVALVIIGSIGYTFQRRRNKRRELHEHLEAAREQERVELAGELHDGPLQDLYATRFVLDPFIKSETLFPDANKLDDLLKKVRSDLRTMTGELQIPRFELGFAEELRLFCDAFCERHSDIQVELHIANELHSLPLKSAQNLFRIFRTAMANVVKHANASTVEVTFAATDKKATLKIADDGIGFEVPKTLVLLTQDKQYGLLLMQNYAASINGKCSLTSAPGSGTTVEVLIPINPQFWWKKAKRASL